MLTTIRTHSGDENFRILVRKLDNDLWNRYGNMQLEYQQYNIIENLHTVVLVYENEKPVGCGCFKKFEADCVELKRLYVDAACRGKGIGYSIINELEKWAKEMGNTAMVLETASGQPEAIHLYRKYGFTDIQRYGQYADKERSICMRKEIT